MVEEVERYIRELARFARIVQPARVRVLLAIYKGAETYTEIERASRAASATVLSALSVLQNEGAVVKEGNKYKITEYGRKVAEAVLSVVGDI